jgi:ABC-type Fe3+ transport system substrate-binding protein
MASTLSVSLVGSLVVAALLALAGCAPQAAAPASAPASKPAAAPAQPAASAPQAQQPAPLPAEWTRLLEAGRREGKVVVIGPPFPNLREAYTQEFPKDTGIQLEYLGVPQAEITVRAEREAASGQPTIDAMIGGGGELNNMLPKGYLDPIKPLLVLPEVVDPTAWKGDRGVKWMDQQGQFMPIGSSWVMTDLFVNTQQVPPGSIRSWNDLLDPKWKGRIIAHDPAIIGSGAAVGRYLLTKFGEQFVVDLFVGQQPVLTNDSRQVSEGVARGTYPIGMGSAVVDVEEFRKVGLPIAREFPADGPGSLVGGASVLKLVKGAPNPNAANVFVNWGLAKNGQTAFSRAILEVSLRKDVPTDHLPPYIVPKPDAVYDVDQYDYDFYMNTSPVLFQRLRALLGR